MLLHLFSAIVALVWIPVESTIPILWLKQALDYLQAQGIAPIDVPRHTTSPVDTTSDEHSSRQEGSIPDGNKPEVKVEGTVKEEYEMSENEDDDDIKALLVCRFCCSYLSMRFELFLRP
jgi:hypothetical protein